MSIDWPDGYSARRYGGRADHAAMATVLTAFQALAEDGELVTTEQMDLTYSLIPQEDLQRDVIIIEHSHDGIVGYGRTGFDDTTEGRVHYLVLPIHPRHLTRALFVSLVAALEQRAAERAERSACDPPDAAGEAGEVGNAGAASVLRCWLAHPGPGQPLGDTPVAWMHEIGYAAVRFGASMVRPHLQAIPDLAPPDGVEVRAVAIDDLRAIWEADVAAFAGSFGAQAPTDEQWLTFRDDPIADPSMWKVAWAAGRVVGQVRSYINHEENESRGRLRGYTEHISTHADWRGRGLASALLAASLRELRDRGMAEAALGVDTENPANAFAIYQRLGFVLTGYEAVMDKPLLSRQ